MNTLTIIWSVILTSIFWFGVGFYVLFQKEMAYAKVVERIFNLTHDYASLLLQFERLKAARSGISSYTNLSALDLAYKSFGLARGASQQEIKNKFRILIKKYHPDINKAPDAALKFKLINEQFNLLKSAK